MKLKPLLSLILFAAFFVANAQQNNIPSDQTLYIDFNGGISDNSLSGHLLATTNISFEADRNNQPLRAGRFGGCSALSHIQISDFADKMNFTTGGTITLWAKPDLNNSMDPATGNCISSGRHTFFSKGGDGFNTPPGFYAYTSINNGIQTIAFAASSNSGNFEDTFTMPYTDAWHHYAFVFTTTNLKVYVDGVLKRNVAIALNFTEANNETLYVGTLGPKSSPVNGITYWFPFGGLMDEFRLFTKVLTAAEVTGVYNESYDMIAPSVQRKVFVGGRSGYYSGANGSMFNYDDKTIVFSNINTRFSFRTSDGWETTKLTSFDSNGQIVWENVIYDRLNSNAYNTVEASSFVIGDSSETLVEISRSYFGGGRFLIIDNTVGTTIADVQTGYEKVIGVFKHNQEYIIIFEERSYSSTYGENYAIKKFDNVGNQISSLQLNGSYIKDFSWDANHGLLLTGNFNTYIVNISSMSYSQLSTSGKICKWVGNNFIVSNDSYTYRINQSFTYSVIANGLRNVSILNNGDYIVHAAYDIKKYNPNHVLQAAISTINSDVKLFPYSNKMYVKNGQQIEVYDIFGNLLWGTLISSNGTSGNFIQIKELKSLEFVIISGNFFNSKVFKIDEQGRHLWSTSFANNEGVNVELAINNSNLKLLVTTKVPSYFGAGTNKGLYLLDMTGENSPCSYIPNIGNEACNNTLKYLGGIVWDRYEGFPVGISSFLERNVFGIVDETTQSDTYKFTVRQGVCEKSVEKYVTVSDAYNPPPPILSATFNPICGGDSTTLIASGCNGVTWWSGTNWSRDEDNTVIAYPTASTEYTVRCYVSNTPYGNCTSDESTPFTVNVTTLPQVIGLAGNSPLNATYRAERINSEQNVIINGAIDYKSKNAIVLNPGFSTQNNAVFNAKIVSSCTE